MLDTIFFNSLLTWQTSGNHIHFHAGPRDIYNIKVSLHHNNYNIIWMDSSNITVHISYHKIHLESFV